MQDLESRLQQVLEEGTYAEHVELGRVLHAQKERSQWALGDLATSVEVKYGQRTLQRFAREIGEEYETLREYRRVTDAYPTSARRLADLPYAHFHAVAAQPDRLELLATAESEGLSVAGLRSLIASRRRFRTPELPAGTFATIVADPPWHYQERVSLQDADLRAHFAAHGYSIWEYIDGLWLLLEPAFGAHNRIS